MRSKNENLGLLTINNNNTMNKFEKINESIRNDDAKKLGELKDSADIMFSPQEPEHHKTSLHIACENGANNCLRVLLEWNPSKESIDLPNADGNTALHLAVKTLNSAAIQSLLAAGAYPNSRNDQGHSPLHTLVYRCISGDEPSATDVNTCLLHLLDNRDTDIDAINKSKLTPLHAASDKLSKSKMLLIQLCKKLITKGAKVDDRCHNKLRDSGIECNYTASNESSRGKVAQLLNCLIDANHENIVTILKSFSSSEAVSVANIFIGSKRILYYLVDENMNDAVPAILHLGANPRTKNYNGEQPLHRALARGNPSIVGVLINGMKQGNKVDLRKESFSLIKRSLECNATRSDSMACLKRLFNYDVLINANQKSDSDQTALHLAAATSNQEAIAILLENGAYLGERRIVDGKDRGTILHTVLPITIEKTMNNCIKSFGGNTADEDIDILDPDYALKMDYSFLIPSSSDEINDKSPKIYNEAEVLFDISQNRQLRNTIKHPLVQTFLYAKWRKVIPLYLINLLLYLTFVILLTVFMYGLKNQRVVESNLKNSTTNFPDMVPSLEKELSAYQTHNALLKTVILLITLYMAIKEGFQIYFTYKSYFRCIENYLELFLIFSVLASCMIPLSVEGTRHLAAWSMVVAWYEFVLVLGRLPKLAIYITMLRHVSWNFLKLCFLFGFLIIAFSISFNIIFQTQNEIGSDFSDFWTTVPRAIVMSTGEFEYSSISETFTNNSARVTSTVLIFLVFLFLIFLVLMNVMTGLAVTDAKEIVEDALLYSLKSRLQLVYLNEQLFTKVPFLHKHLPRLHLLGSRQLLVKINKPVSTERIEYGPEGRVGTCKLGHSTADVVRRHRLDTLAERDLENIQDPQEKIISLLHQLREELANK